MEMASVSWFYLFNIQVRANCTTACNIQAALRYVELTHIIEFFFFPLYLFYKNVHAAWNWFWSHARLHPLFPAGAVRGAEHRMSTGECPRPAILFFFCFRHIPRDAGGKLSLSETQRVFLFFAFFWTAHHFYDSFSKGFQTKSKLLCLSLNVNRM